ncbi:hypothetical protein QN219_31480 [Sinorhizobium sp. 7-81]|uniref:hypothetical protein n=1 Tax=Sinorhizobium sp. 8-89 TaxID=3049089 RepID=UPI0024C437B5|nr:hypothetical protein [Sinorhizobium sp. 8-89]MDK1494464.1 hypothetical protein [Sinorhizobium sp. 8-89]
MSRRLGSELDGEAAQYGDTLELMAAIVESYRLGNRSDKRRIQDEFVAVTGYHRKHAIRVPAIREKRPPGKRSNSLRYGSNVREALIGVCGRPRSGCVANASTVDTFTSGIVARGCQRRRAGMSSADRRSVPVRTFGDWNDPPPSFV